MILLDQSFWEIQITKEKGRGIFAKKDIDPGVVIGDYIGKVIRTAVEDTSEKNGLYLLYYHDYASIYPEDITAIGIHLANHSCTPNSWIYTYKGHTLFFTLRKIHAGEEITISYLLSPKRYCDNCTHTCICGSKQCTGTMHLSEEQFAAWTTFNEAEAKKTKRAPIRYGKILPKLKEYPTSIHDNDIYPLFGNPLLKPIIYKQTLDPTIPQIREMIRATGKTIVIPHQSRHIYGIRNNTMIMAE